MDLAHLRELLQSPVLATTTAVGLCSFVLGYYAGLGKSLFAYNENSRARAAAGTSDDEEYSDEDEVEGNDGNMVRSKAGMVLEECKMVLVVRADIKMDRGKIAAQCCHAALAAYKAALKETPSYVSQWERLGQAKIAVKCQTEEEMREVEANARRLGITARSIHDAGRTQIAAGTRTVVGVGPAPKSVMDQVTGHLKLL
ncbi:unnamed protein product [Tilletia controversa]|uniref:peptidyl-tRNA hydrolase n=3 Tax=Tilletia TaxID=13289 RepID=A0A8X7SUQ9_9BASI|nr:hypothetical protein CF328_g5616 [Tilletia controversa]KAE8191991.1 hypothetical protein CF336_g4618 [Tilletia laevis]KAE8256439.1 hypothetical protein A4X03_0g5392 [Tilletia caries]KAE8194713.1 hypothetical protein CF335_g5277 [Tilletia laevis]KAE8243145.1 hypothetical protein A4X06_0g6521 [Tilletia controversa]